MAPLDVCRRARPQGLIAAPGSRGAGVGVGEDQSLSTTLREVAPHAHTPFAFLPALAQTLLRPPRPQRSE